MPREFKLPDLGEGIHEGEVVEVLVSVGDKVEDGSPVMVIETDKAETEVPSPVNGVVKEIKVKSGDIVNVGDVLMVFAEAGEAEEEETEDKEKQPEKGEKEVGLDTFHYGSVSHNQAGINIFNSPFRTNDGYFLDRICFFRAHYFFLLRVKHNFAVWEFRLFWWIFSGVPPGKAGKRFLHPRYLIY